MEHVHLFRGITSEPDFKQTYKEFASTFVYYCIFGGTPTESEAKLPGVLNAFDTKTFLAAESATPVNAQNQLAGVVVFEPKGWRAVTGEVHPDVVANHLQLKANQQIVKFTAANEATEPVNAWRKILMPFVGAKEAMVVAYSDSKFSLVLLRSTVHRRWKNTSH